MRVTLAVMLVAVLVLGGCVLSSEKVALVQRTSGWAHATSVYADGNGFSYEQMKEALRTHDALWDQFYFATRGLDANGR